MNTLPAESYAEAFQLLVSISGVLGGLAFTAVAALLSVSASAGDPRRLDWPTKITVASAVPSVICLIVAAVAWSYMALKATQASGSEQAVPIEIIRLHTPVSITFTIGICLLFASVGASGFIDSIKLGVWTSLLAILGTILIVLLLFSF